MLVKLPVPLQPWARLSAGAAAQLIEAAVGTAVRGPAGEEVGKVVAGSIEPPAGDAVTVFLTLDLGPLVDWSGGPAWAR